MKTTLLVTAVGLALLAADMTFAEAQVAGQRVLVRRNGVYWPATIRRATAKRVHVVIPGRNNERRWYKRGSRVVRAFDWRAGTPLRCRIRGKKRRVRIKSRVGNKVRVRVGRKIFRVPFRLCQDRRRTAQITRLVPARIAGPRARPRFRPPRARPITPPPSRTSPPSRARPAPPPRSRPAPPPRTRPAPPPRSRPAPTPRAGRLTGVEAAVNRKSFQATRRQFNRTSTQQFTFKHTLSFQRGFHGCRMGFSLQRITTLQTTSGNRSFIENKREGCATFSGNTMRLVGHFQCSGRAGVARVCKVRRVRPFQVANTQVRLFRDGMRVRLDGNIENFKLTRRF